ncbi:MAG: hypothetical protein JWM34_4126 [Ilumatobacteraceae bacterium]|nr:hypothetical protein [Ilumatobacteraceae bacterium]
MPVEALLRRSLRDVADRIDSQPPPWPPGRSTQFDDADEHRVGIRVLAAAGAICLVLVAGIGLWLIRTNPSGSVPTDGTPAAPGPSWVGNTLATTGVTNSSIAAPSTTVVSIDAGSSAISIGTLPPDVVAERNPADGSALLGDVGAQFPVLAPARVDTDLTFDPAVGGAPITLHVSFDEICVRRTAADGTGGGACDPNTDPHYVETRVGGGDTVTPVQVLLLDSTVQVTSVPGSCTFSLVGTDPANRLDLWACTTTDTATVEVDLQAPGADIVRTYIQGALAVGPAS